MKRSTLLRPRRKSAVLLGALAAFVGVSSHVTAAPHCHYQIAGGTVLDSETGLLWQQALNNTTYSPAAAASYCSSLGLAGGGFRLPTIAELQTIVDVGTTDPTIDLEAFPSTPSDGFWTTTPSATGNGNMWAVNFTDGTANLAIPGLAFYARCVK